MIRLVIFLITILCVWYIASQIYNFALAIKSPATKVEEDKNSILEYISKLTSVLIPLNLDELKLVSTKQIGKREIRSIDAQVGTYTTIYDEPIFHYGIKFYEGKSKAGLAVVQTSRENFLYYINEESTAVYIDERLIGHINKSGVLKSSDGMELALIDLDENQRAHAVYISGREVGKVTNPKYDTYINQRAYDINSYLSGEEKDLFLAMTLLGLIKTNS